VMILASLPMGAWVRRQKSLVATVNRTRILFRSTIGSFALLPLLPPSIAGHMLVAVRGLASVPDAGLMVAETTLIGRLTTPQRRARMLSTRAAVLGFFSAIFGFLAGQWLDRAAFPFNYQMLFLTALFSGVGSVWALGKARVPDSAPVPAARKRMALSEMLTLVRGSPAFARFLAAEFIFRIGMTLPTALYSIYRVRDLGSTDGWIGILQTIEQGGLVVSYLVLARLLTHGWVRRWLWLGCVGMALFPLATALATTPQMLVFAPIMSGLFSPSMSIFLTDTLFLVSPEEERTTYVATNALLSSITGFAMPMLGTLLSDWTGVRGAIFISAGLRVLGGLSFLALGVVGRRRLPDAGP
jgi:MFS family permease